MAEIFKFLNYDGFLFNHIWGKTLRDGDANIFRVRRNPQDNICAIRSIERYMDIAQQMGIDLTTGYMFRKVVRIHFPGCKYALFRHINALGEAEYVFMDVTYSGNTDFPYLLNLVTFNTTTLMYNATVQF